MAAQLAHQAAFWINEVDLIFPRNFFATARHGLWWRHYILWSAVCPLSPVMHDAISPYLVEEFHWNLERYLPCKWALLKRFSRSEVKGQGYSKVKCTLLAEE